MSAGQGDQADGTWQLTVALPGEPPKQFHLKTASPPFRVATWLGFVSDGIRPAVYYVDNLRLSCGDGQAVDTRAVHAEEETASNVTDDFSATKPDVVIHYRETYAAFPDLIRLHNGNLLMVTREGTHHGEDEQHGRVVACLSTDEGHTWGEAVVICDHPHVDDRDPFACQTKDGTIWVGCQGQRAWTRGQTKEAGAKKTLEQDYDSYIVRSFDGGKTWEEPILVSKTITGDSYIMYPVMEMSNGEFLWMGCSPIWKILKDGSRQWLSPQKKVYHETHILKNPCAKKDFRWETYIHPQLGQFDEWDIAELEPGHLICILRTSPDSNQFAQAESFDYGRTWKNHRLSGIVHNAPNRPRIDKLADGTLVVSYGLRRESKITAIPTFDGGRSWPADRRATVLYNPNYGPDWDFTYTAMVPTPTKDGKYLFIYYAHPGKPGGSNHRGIYGNFVPARAFEP